VSFELPPMAIEELPSGLRLLALRRRGLPLFHARLSLPAGSSADPRGKEGLAQFTLDLLRRGTRRRDARGVDELIEGMGASLMADCGSDESALALTVPDELRAQALEALLEVALEPAFADGEVASARRRALAALQSDLDEPATVAARALIRLGFGPEHPYGHASHGTRAAVEGFGRADVADLHARLYRQRGSLLALVADDDPRSLLDQARGVLARGQWPAAAPLLPERPFPACEGPPAPLRALAIHKPDSTQAQVRIVAPGVPRNTPRHAEAVVANSALGGGFTSLLVDAIRVDRGLSYSVSTRLLMYRRAGLALFSSFTRNETLRELIDLALEKMRGYAAAGPAPEALQKARTYLAGLFPFGLESHESLAEQVADAILDGLGVDHLRDYRDRVLAVTPEAARAAAAELSPARPGAQIVVVGDGETARSALADLCPVEVRQLEEFA